VLDNFEQVAAAAVVVAERYSHVSGLRNLEGHQPGMDYIYRVSMNIASIPTCAGCRARTQTLLAYPSAGYSRGERVKRH